MCDLGRKRNGSLCFHHLIYYEECTWKRVDTSGTVGDGGMVEQSLLSSLKSLSANSEGSLFVISLSTGAIGFSVVILESIDFARGLFARLQLFTVHALVTLLFFKMGTESPFSILPPMTPFFQCFGGIGGGIASIEGCQWGESGGSFSLFVSCSGPTFFPDRSSGIEESGTENVRVDFSECVDLAREFQQLEVSRNEGVYPECTGVDRYDEFKSCSELSVVSHLPYE